MPAGMILKSEPFASSLWDPNRHFTFENFCRDAHVAHSSIGELLSLQLFLRYSEWFTKQTNQLPVDDTLVHLKSARAGFHLKFSSGQTLTSRNVVLAIGHMAYCAIPSALSSTPEPFVAHSSRMSDIRSYAQRDVIVIGAGQAALETAALLNESGARVRILVRDRQVKWWGRPSYTRPLIDRIRFPDAALSRGWESMALSELPRMFRLFPVEKRHRFVSESFGPGGAWWLRTRVDGQIPIDVQTSITSASVVDNRVELLISRADSPSKLVADHVIAATGYEVNIGNLKFISPELREHIQEEGLGIPKLTSRLESSVPGLFFAGLTTAPTFGPVMRFVYGAKHTAPLISNALRAR